MWGCNAAIITLGIIAILIIRHNGLYYFSLDALGLSWFCGYLLMLPEIVIATSWVIIYWTLNKNIKNSIN